jgi:3-oxoacyl-[acyl-carrier protein] reductase
METNKIALVTGASRGIGRAIAIQLASDGFNVIINFKSNSKASKEVAGLIRNLDRQAWVIKGDVGKESDVKSMFEKIKKFTNHIDIVVNNAGFDYGYLIEDFKLSEMKEVIETNLIGKISVTKYALSFLKKSSKAQIINIASRLGTTQTIETVGAYAPASAGIIKFTECCALEFSKYKIRANCVAPGFTDTDMNRNIYSDPEFWRQMNQNNPSGRIGQPEDIANVVSFLASDKADYINAEVIQVNGGSNVA